MNLTMNTTTSRNESNILYPDSVAPNKFVISIVLLVGSATVLCNIPSVLILIVSLLRKRKLKHVTILSLSITYALFGLSWLLLTDTYSGEKISFKNCFLRTFVFGISLMAANFHVLGICVERVLVICMNMTILKTRKTLTSICIAILSWTISILIITLESVFYMSSYEDFRECSFDILFRNNRQMAFGAIGASSISLQLAIVILMITMLLFLIRHRVKTRGLRVFNKMDIRLCVVIGIVAILYLVVNTPVSIVYLLEGYANIITSRLTRNASFLFAGLNSALNPFVHLFRSKEVRRILKESIKYVLPCKNKVVPTTIENVEGINKEQNI